MATGVYKVLAQGQLAAATAAIGSPSGVDWIVSKIVVVNNDSSARTFGIFYGGSAASNVVIPTTTSLAASGGRAEWSGLQPVADGSTIQGVASVATQLTYTIWGRTVS